MMLLLPLSSKLTSNSLFLLALQLWICLVQSRSFYGSPEEFSSMGDIDWGKRSFGSTLGKRNFGSTLGKRNLGSAMRSFRSPYKRYESPAWAYSSMADSDWGWKKRSSTSPDAELYNIYRNKKLTDDYWKRYGQSYYRPYSYQPSTGYQPYGSSSNHRAGLDDPEPRSLPSVSSTAVESAAAAPSPKANSLKNRNRYAYHSMADMDWGWKKRKRAMTPPLDQLVDEDDYDDIMDLPVVEVDKKSLASLHGKRTPENVNGVEE